MTNSQSKNLTNNLTANRCSICLDNTKTIRDCHLSAIGKTGIVKACSPCRREMTKRYTEIKLGYTEPHAGQTYQDTYVVDIRCEAFGIKSQQITNTIEKAQELVEELKKVWATNQYYSGQGKFSNELFSIKILCISGSDKSVNVVSTWEKYIKVQNKE